MRKQTVREVEIAGRRVFCRVDFNVPLQDGQITDDTRIRSALPTIQYLLSQGAKVILASHLGRPKGQVVEELRLNPVAERLSEYLGQPVQKMDQVVGVEVQQQADAMRAGEVLLLENIRFEPGEVRNDPDLARNLASLAELFVNDAFGTAHRAHASTAGIASYLPSVAGLLLEQELTAFERILTHPDRPMTAIIGGAKVSDKIGVIEHLLERVDHLIIGGGLAYTFLKAQGYSIGNSLVEPDKVELAAALLKRAKELGVQLLLPVDVVVATELAPDVPTQAVEVGAIPEDKMGLDIGPQTRQQFTQVVQASRLVVWNGPMGVFEYHAFAEGTYALAQAVSSSSGYSVVGGGDSIAAIEQSGLTSQIDHISTGGGASLELLEGKQLPGIAALDQGVR